VEVEVFIGIIFLDWYSTAFRGGTAAAGRAGDGRIMIKAVRKASPIGRRDES
jgi:hypothetical protein